MDFVLGVSMTPTTVRMALVEGERADGLTVDHDVFDVAAIADSANTNAPEQVISAILGTQQSALAGGQRLVTTGVTWSDHDEAAALRATGTDGRATGVPQAERSSCPPVAHGADLRGDSPGLSGTPAGGDAENTTGRKPLVLQGLQPVGIHRDCPGQERVMGLEPTTATLATWRSTTELHPQRRQREMAPAAIRNYKWEAAVCKRKPANSVTPVVFV